MSVLEVNHVSIRYLTGDFKEIGLKEYTMRKLKGNYHVQEFWADRDVTFSLEKGDMLGIIGVNGAGKSTLLKAISGIMDPSRGYVRREGNVAALLELASGFDGELTVRENTYLRGAMLGYTRDFMEKKYDEIIDFAELREFQDRPFRQLSSGMKSRLAFSIASLVQPDLLILDEVLSVGDGSFQQKSAEKMREIIHGGATTILVSHSVAQIEELCNKVLWLHKGEQIAFGETEAVCGCYKAFLEDGLSPEEAKKRFAQPVDSKENEVEYEKRVEQTADVKDLPAVEEKSEAKSGSTAALPMLAGGNQMPQWCNKFLAAAKQNWMLLIPFLSTFALLRVSPMIYDGWRGPSYYNMFGGLISYAHYTIAFFRRYVNGRIASNFFSGILESFYSEIPLDIAAALVMTGIIACAIYLFCVKKKTVIACLYAVFVVFMPYKLRVYVVQIALLQYLTPILFLLLVLLLAGKYETTGHRKYVWWLYPLSAIACTWMENTSVAYGVVITAICIRSAVKCKRVDFRLAGVVFLSLISGIFMITAPGTTANRATTQGAQTFLVLSRTQIYSHIRTFFDSFIYSGSLAGLALALVLFIAAASSAVSRWNRRGFIPCLLLGTGNLGWAVSAAYLGWQTHEFRYTAALSNEIYTQLMKYPFVIVALCILYVIWIPLNALILCSPDWNLRMVCLYGICLLLVILPTNQVGARIYAPYYLVMCILTCAILSYNIRDIFSHRVRKKFFTGIVVCLCILAMDFQTQLCARISRVQADRMHRIELLRDEQLLGHSTSDYYLIPVFNVRDAYLGGATTIGTYHYPQFLSRYGLRQGTKLIFSDEDYVLVSDHADEIALCVNVVHQRGKVYLYDYIVSIRQDPTQDYVAIIHERECTGNTYQVTATNGTGWYQVRVMLTDPETGAQIWLNQTVEQYLSEG